MLKVLHKTIDFISDCKILYYFAFALWFALFSGTEEENRECVFSWKEEIGNLLLLWYEGRTFKTFER